MENLYIEGIVKQYFNTGKWKVKEGSSGMNNTTKFLTVDNKEYILRIYESHNDNEKVIFEHEVLKALGERSTSFKVPNPQLTLEGKTIGVGQDGKLVSLATYIKGNNPKLNSDEQFYSLGKIVGEITRELGEIELDKAPIYSSCYELEKAYPKCPLNKVVDFCNNPPLEFKEENDKLQVLSKYFIDFQNVIPKLRTLPHQFIHGDINASNVLEGENKEICAVLDFEFVAKDLRAMDLAICLSEAINILDSNKTIFNRMKEFIGGYNTYIKLSKEEIQVIPNLIMLRRLDVIIHFLVRYYEGVNNSYMTAEEILKEQITKAVVLCEWVSKNEKNIRTLF